MSKHPVTPADESDLRLHLKKQTNKKIGLIDVLQLDKPINSWNAVMHDEAAVLIDALNEEHLTKIGEWLDAQRRKDETLFSVGSSGIEMALGNYWNMQEIFKPVTEWNHPGKTSPLLVISGSCSPVTAKQITWATTNGFEEIELDAIKLCSENGVDERVINEIDSLLQQQKNVIVHTGPKQAQNLSSAKLGLALGAIAKDAVKRSGVKRIVVSGGDTSSYAARVMDIEAVEMIAPLIIGAPLCKIYSKNKMMEGVEVNFKGGQVGDENYFETLIKGGG
jgi:uncharacterized protein YgbK (DUF1537 family)